MAHMMSSAPYVPPRPKLSCPAKIESLDSPYSSPLYNHPLRILNYSPYPCSKLESLSRAAVTRDSVRLLVGLSLIHVLDSILPKMMNAFLGVPILSTKVFRGLYGGPPILGNCQIEHDGLKLMRQEETEKAP